MTRVLSGIVLIGVVLAAVWFAPDWLFLALVIAVLIGAFVEYTRLLAETGIEVPRAAGATAAAVLAAAVGLQVPVTMILAVILLVCCMVVLSRGAPGPQVPATVAATLFPSLYLGLPLGLLAATRVQYGREAVLLVLAIVVVSDTAQFYVGSRLGRHRLAPAVSPKKSIEGALGGLAAGALVAVLFGRVAWPALGPAWLVAMGLVLASLGIIGDLFESLLKRSANVKDSSGLIPGHGGILDRIDALLLVIPGYYVFLHFLR